MRERINFISVTQSLAIILVVLGHSFPLDRNSELTPDLLKYIYDFFLPVRMPYFMLLSGFLFYLSHQNRNIEYAGFIKKKAKRLIVPYLVISTIAFFPKALFPYLADREITLSLKCYLEGIIYPQDNPIIVFWFLPTLFLIFFAAPFFRDIVNLGNIYLNIVFLLLLTAAGSLFPGNINLLNISGAVAFLKFFFLGCLLCKYWAAVESYFLGKILLPLIYLILLSPSVFLTEISHKSLTYFALSLTGILFMLSLGKTKILERSKFLNQFSIYTYQVYLLHWFFGVGGRIFYKMGILGFYSSFIIMFLGGTFLPVLTAIIIKKYLPKLKPVFGM